MYCLKAFGPLTPVASFTRASVQLVAVVVSDLLVRLLSMCCELFAIRKSSIAAFEVACFHALVLVLLFLELGNVQAGISLPQCLGVDINDLTTLQVFTTRIVQHVFAINILLRIPNVRKYAGSLP